MLNGERVKVIGVGFLDTKQMWYLVYDENVTSMRYITRIDNKLTVVDRKEVFYRSNHTFYDFINEMLHCEAMQECVKTNDFKTITRYLLPFFSEKDSGKYGKILEINLKLYLNGYRGNSCIVSSVGKVDVKHNNKRIQIKSNCGEINEFFTDDREYIKHDIVAYSMDNQNHVNEPWNVTIIPSEDFIPMLENLDLIRRKKSTSGYMRITIQTYKNSKRKTVGLFNALNEYITAEQFK